MHWRSLSERLLTAFQVGTYNRMICELQEYRHQLYEQGKVESALHTDCALNRTQKEDLMAWFDTHKFKSPACCWYQCSIFHEIFLLRVIPSL